MDLKECYTAMEGDYDDVINRLRKDTLVQKFLLKFLDDGSYDLLMKSLEEKNYEEAFRASHTIKGVCQNLGIPKLMGSSSQLTELLRSGWQPEAEPLVEQVTKDYQQTISAIKEFQEGL